MTAGFGIPIKANMVGAMSPKTPLDTFLMSLSTNMNGTGLVV
jgi:hypothetical protein